jgi:hypothetical protein
VNRFWIIGAAVVLVAAGVVGWLTAGNEARLDTVPILADVTTAGCDGVGQVHLRVGNASGRVVIGVEGVLSIAATDSEAPIPIGNFVLSEPIAPGQAARACVPVDEARIGGRARSTLIWLARATIVSFAD